MCAFDHLPLAVSGAQGVASCLAGQPLGASGLMPPTLHSCPADEAAEARGNPGAPSEHMDRWVVGRGALLFTV